MTPWTEYEGAGQPALAWTGHFTEGPKADTSNFSISRGMHTKTILKHIKIKIYIYVPETGGSVPMGFSCEGFPNMPIALNYSK